MSLEVPSHRRIDSSERARAYCRRVRELGSWILRRDDTEGAPDGEECPSGRRRTASINELLHDRRHGSCRMDAKKQVHRRLLPAIGGCCTPKNQQCRPSDSRLLRIKVMWRMLQVEKQRRPAALRRMPMDSLQLQPSGRIDWYLPRMSTAQPRFRNGLTWWWSPAAVVNGAKAS